MWLIFQAFWLCVQILVDTHALSLQEITSVLVGLVKPIYLMPLQEERIMLLSFTLYMILTLEQIEKGKMLDKFGDFSKNSNLGRM